MINGNTFLVGSALKSLQYRRKGFLCSINIGGMLPPVLEIILISAQFLKVSGRPQPTASVPFGQVPHMFAVQQVHCKTHCVQVTPRGSLTLQLNIPCFSESCGIWNPTSLVPETYSGYLSKHSCVASYRGLLLGHNKSSNRPQ